MNDSSAKVQAKPISSNSMVYTIEGEDHTLGNILRQDLLRQKGVYVAGYRIPHPLETNMTLSVSTNGTITPHQALNQSIDALVRECDAMDSSLQQSLLKYRTS